MLETNFWINLHLVDFAKANGCHVKPFLFNYRDLFLWILNGWFSFWNGYVHNGTKICYVCVLRWEGYSHIREYCNRMVFPMHEYILRWDISHVWEYWDRMIISYAWVYYDWLFLTYENIVRGWLFPMYECIMMGNIGKGW